MACVRRARSTRSPAARRGGAPRAISRAGGASNQWKACATVTASTEPSGAGCARRAVHDPSRRAHRPGLLAHAGDRLDATTSAPGSSRRVSLPVPAARSHTASRAAISELPDEHRRRPPRGRRTGGSRSRRAGRSHRRGVEDRGGADAQSSSQNGRRRRGARGWGPQSRFQTITLRRKKQTSSPSLVDALRLDRDDAPVALRRLLDVDHLGLGVDRVAVEGRLACRSVSTSRLAIAAPLTSGTLMPEHERVHEVADDDVPALHRLVLREPLVGVQRVVVHRDHAEQVVVVLGDRLARPVPVDVAGDEVLEVAAERAVVDRHAGNDEIAHALTEAIERAAGAAPPPWCRTTGDRRRRSHGPM